MILLSVSILGNVLDAFYGTMLFDPQISLDTPCLRRGKLSHQGTCRSIQLHLEPRTTQFLTVSSSFALDLIYLESQGQGLTCALSGLPVVLNTWFQLRRRKADAAQDLRRHYPSLHLKGHLHVLLPSIHTTGRG